MYTPSITAYGAVKPISSARSGSIARKHTSHASDASAATTLPAPSYVTRSIATPSRLRKLARQVDGDSARFAGRVPAREDRVAEIDRGTELARGSEV